MSGSDSGVMSTGVGLTVMVKVRVGPGQLTDPLVNVGVTLMVAVIGTVLGLVAVNVKLSVLPESPRPIAELLFDHEYVVVPLLFNVVNVTVVLAPLQTDRLAGWFTCPVGLTVTVNVFGGPVQKIPPYSYCGVTRIIPVMGELVVFVALKEISPLPVPGRPIPELELVQL